MPIYEYKCKACEHKFDKLQKMSDPVLTDCPDCGKSELVKLVSAAGFRLKGTGWYETDFKNSGKKSASTDSKNSSDKVSTNK
jgi:putative FmdB family regulatory protein